MSCQVGKSVNWTESLCDIALPSLSRLSRTLCSSFHGMEEHSVEWEKEIVLYLEVTTKPAFSLLLLLYLCLKCGQNISVWIFFWLSNSCYLLFFLPFNFFWKTNFPAPPHLRADPAADSTEGQVAMNKLILCCSLRKKKRSELGLVYKAAWTLTLYCLLCCFQN